ncbi:FAD-dependent oxidoreductase [Amycolatopsis sp. NPDC101161]|uniref:FAD-dependent oxidoreductase n=1 Tax=Amycolatopsis sp. NPDC101161 TaxID=3363940 RepID=UPI0038087B80
MSSNSAAGGDRAVVLGASMAGLLAARVLSETYAEVVLVDRDKLTGETTYRRGVPHGRHAHGLVARGQQILEGHFPGLKDELSEAGVKCGDFSSDVHWIFNGRRMKPAPSGLDCVPAIRPLLEYHVRKRVQAIPNVVFLDRHDILGLESTEDGARITGARVQAHGGDGPTVFPADLVVDTTGKGSRTPLWLAELGYDKPVEERVKIDLAYTTRHYRLPADPFGTDLAIIPAATPETPRGAFFHRMPGGGGRVELSLTGVLGDHPPTDAEGFTAYVKSLPIPDIHDAISTGVPLDDPVTFRYPASIWKHYEKLRRFPAGLLVMGDAVCSFNPIYAQGMTVAALESLVLQQHLRRDPVPAARPFFKEIAKKIAGAWSVSAGGDMGYAGAEGRKGLMTDFVNRYVARLQEAAVEDSVLTNAFIRVAGLIDPPQSLLKPKYALRVLRHRRRPQAVLPPAAEPPAPQARDLAA